MRNWKNLEYNYLIVKDLIQSLTVVTWRYSSKYETYYVVPACWSTFSLWSFAFQQIFPKSGVVDWLSGANLIYRNLISHSDRSLQRYRVWLPCGVSNACITIRLCFWHNQRISCCMSSNGCSVGVTRAIRNTKHLFQHS